MQATTKLGVKKLMHYTYKAAWSVVGGINLPAGAQPIELYSSERYRFALTRDVDELLADIDRASAVGRLMLKSLFGQRGTSQLPDALEAEINEIKAERAKKIGSQAVLFVEANGDIDAEITGQTQEHEDFIVTFDAIDKQLVRQAHRSDIEAMKLAVAFESSVPSRFAMLSEGMYLTDGAGKPIYSISFSMSGEASVSSGISSEGVERITTRYALLQQADDMESVQRLVSQMADFGSDRLKAFLSGWAALEIFIAKSFKIYEQAFLSPLTNAGQPTLRERFLDRIRGVMKDKYRLTDKFVAVTAVLFPSAPDSEIQNDIKKFSQLKGLRDSIFHGDEFAEKDLPVHDLAALLRKYVLAHIETPNPALNTDAPTSGAPVS